ncbi:hypothetical protein KsCSTR_26500 [Candidatus Kuenenia stuttgartiensis]|uniref:Uncharacterized protein n=1 Tax=Kuenenia stuttgartiensis TaxID=174633 RepID=Q1Q7A8_KUEST|nr:hypothetical protein KsCSTR_26500 [Candidatus Kuenenia stuttgartiensis]CAJ73455.1 unknown protein [Candidatus Kuenenia stuttgartiensis]
MKSKPTKFTCSATNLVALQMTISSFKRLKCYNTFHSRAKFKGEHISTCVWEKCAGFAFLIIKK